MCSFDSTVPSICWPLHAKVKFSQFILTQEQTEQLHRIQVARDRATARRCVMTSDRPTQMRFITIWTSRSLSKWTSPCQFDTGDASDRVSSRCHYLERLRSEWLLRSMKSFGWAPAPRVSADSALNAAIKRSHKQPPGHWGLCSGPVKVCLCPWQKCVLCRSEIFSEKSPRPLAGSSVL